MLKKIIIYSTSNGLQRAIIFLASIFLVKSNSIEAVGEYILMQTIAQMLIPLLTLNVTVALAREANFNNQGAIKLLRLIRVSSTVVAGFGMLLGIAFKSYYWLFFGIALGATEALFACVNAYFLGQERSTKILTMSMTKVACYITLICFAYLRFISIYTLMISMFTLNYIISAYFTYLAIDGSRNSAKASDEVVSPKQMLLYSAATLPHTVALWVSVSSDRLLLGYLIGKEAVVQYTMNYTIAQSMVLVITGVVSALPPRVANDSKTWRTPSHVILFLTKLTAVCLIVASLNILIVYFDRIYLNLIPKLTIHSYILVGLISSGFFFSLLYVFFASYLYLNRSTEALKISGFVLAPVNLIIMFLCVKFWGQIGAAAALVFSYFSFGVAYGYAATRVEKIIGDIWWKVMLIFLSFLLIVIFISNLFLFLDAQ